MSCRSVAGEMSAWKTREWPGLANQLKTKGKLAGANACSSAAMCYK